MVINYRVEDVLPPPLFRQVYRVIVTTVIIIHYCNKRGEAQLSPACCSSHSASVNNGVLIMGVLTL